MGSGNGVYRCGHLSALAFWRHAELIKVSLSLSGGSEPNYVRLEWEAGDEEIRCPPTTHFIAMIDDLTDMLHFDFEDIDGMDNDAGDVQDQCS